MSNPKELAKLLFDRALLEHVKFPKVWDDSKIMQTCGATLMLHRKDDSFDIEAALNEIIEKYGQEESKVSDRKEKKRKLLASDDSANQDSAKKASKLDTVAEERNRELAEAIKEMASVYFKNKDVRKGGVFSKAAKALRECPEYISSGKVALSLKGIGKGIAGYIQEFLDNGSIVKLEELRAGTA